MLDLVKKLKASGVAIIYISHRLNEIFEIADKVTVMRDGNKISSMDIKDTDIDNLIKLMVNRELNTTYPERDNLVQKEVLLKLQDVTGNGDKNISLELHKGEILGFGGLVGSGRTELAEILFGMKVKTNGKIFWKGKEINFKSSKQAIQEGIILCPEDRRKLGLFLSLNIQNNISMSVFKKYSKHLVIDKNRLKDLAQDYKEKLSIKAPNMQQFVKNLSGGNQQKVVLAKALNTQPELIILDEPTRGIDVGAKHEIYLLMNKLIAQGKTIIMISSEMEELMGMSDRIIVFAEGHCTGEVLRKNFNQEKIMEFASKEYSEEII
jgi:ribose transport system ATP-binding protein